MRDGGGGVVVAQQEHVQQVLVGHVLAAVEHELIGVDDAALAHHEHVHARHRLLAEQAHDVGVEVARGHRVLLVGEAVDRVDARLDARGALEVELGGGGLHLLGELCDELAVLARQEALDALDVDLVLLGRDAAAARAGAEAHVRIEARPRLAVEQRERVLVQAALESAPIGARCGAQRHDAAGDVHHVAGGAAVGVGAEVLRVGLVLLARVLDGGEHVALRERDERVGLVVLEVGVEEGGVLVDEVLLKHERLVLVLHHEVVEGVDLVDQQRDLRTLVLVVHVLAHAGAQLLGLADVDDLARLVLPQVHARQRGHAVELALDALELGALRLAPMLAHGALERRPAAAFAFEALGGVGVGFGIAVALGIEAEPKALYTTRVGRPEAVVGEREAVRRNGIVVFVHAPSIANRTGVPLSARPLHAVCKRSGAGEERRKGGTDASARPPATAPASRRRAHAMRTNVSHETFVRPATERRRVSATTFGSMCGKRPGQQGRSSARQDNGRAPNLCVWPFSLWRRRSGA